MTQFIADLVFLFAVIDPIGTVPVFIAATVGMTTSARHRIALRAMFISAGLLLLSIVVG